jgi:hypothetical protein
MRASPATGTSLITVAGLSLLTAATPRAQALPGEPEGPVRGCATMIVAQRQQGHAAGGSGLSARTSAVQAATLSARTYLTEHFAFHYTLARNVHRVKLTALDAPLKARVDSLLNSLGGLTTFKRDSSLHAKLDSMGAPLPQYVSRAAVYFERAWRYYDSLDMRMPVFASADTLGLAYPSASNVFAAPGQGRFVVDVADINNGYGEAGAFYGIALPPELGGSVMLENDFLYGASYDAGTDQVTGSVVYADIGGVRRYYDTAWDAGIKVTASHEFYHTVQYAYTGSPFASGNALHAWYELSAVGMEEQLAPEVNDYFSYLPTMINYHRQYGIFTVGGFVNYGNGVFHVFLARKLGAGFDVPIWEALRNNGNQLGPALVQGAGSQARWDSLFDAYTAAMSLAGAPASATSPLAFSPDMPQWPRPRFDLSPTAGTAQLDMPAGTFRVLRPPATGAVRLTLAGFSGSWRVDSSGTGYQSAFFPGNSMAFAKGAAGTVSVLALGNSSLTQARQAVLLRDTGIVFAATLNPVSRKIALVYFLAPVGGATDSLRITAESGRRVATLRVDTSGAFWGWNLRDPQNRLVPPGIYFYRTAGQAAKPLVVVP